MTNPTRLEDFVGHKESAVKTVALLLVEAQESLQNKEMSLDEFKEISEDLLELERIDQLSSTLEQKVKIKQAFDAMTKIISLFK